MWSHASLWSWPFRWQVYQLDDGKTAVVTIHTFMPDIPMDSMEDFIKAYYFFVNESMVAFDLANK